VRRDSDHGMMRAMKTSALALTAASMLLATSAAADSKSWTAVKGSISPKATVVLGGNVDAVRKTKAFAGAMQLLFSEEPDAKEAFDLVKSECAIDVPAAISDFTVVMNKDEKPLVVLGLSGVDEAKAMKCFEAVALKKTGQAVTLDAKKKGRVTMYSLHGDSKQVYAAWLAKDVLAFTDEPSEKGRLEKFLAGKVAKGELGKRLAKVSSDAPIWAAVVLKERENGLTMLGGYGTIDLAAGKFTANAHVVLGSAKEVQTAVALSGQAMTEAKQHVTSSPNLAAIFNTITIAGNGNLLDVTAAMPDQDLKPLMTEFDHLF
jgi:hypothetical protein